MSDATTNAAFWDKLAERYAAKPVDDPEAFDRKIAITVSHMTPESTVLDVGCGTGSLALRLAPHGAEVHGLDLSSEMIRIARGKAADAGVSNVTFHVGPFDDSFTAFAPESLDGLCAYSILHLVADRAAALERIYDLIRPGGFFISSTVRLGESWVPYTPILTVMRWLGRAPMVKTVSKRTLAEELQAAGFVDIDQPDVGAVDIVGFFTARKPQ